MKCKQKQSQLELLELNSKAESCRQTYPCVRDILIRHWRFLAQERNCLASTKFFVKEERWFVKTLAKSSTHSSLNLNIGKQMSLGIYLNNPTHRVSHLKSCFRQSLNSSCLTGVRRNICMIWRMAANSSQKFSGIVCPAWVNLFNAKSKTSGEHLLPSM